MGYSYEGLCGANIDEEWRGNTQFLQCSHGRGMQCDGGCYATELCDGCDIADRQNYYQNGGNYGSYQF